MPATTPKQERFMQAVSHNPSFAKKVGVPQSVGKEFTVRAGNAKIGKRDTKHGSMDLPVASLDKYSGFKKGGIMRKGKRFDVGGGVSTEDWLKEATKDYSRKGETLEDAAARRSVRDTPAPIRESVAPTKPAADIDTTGQIQPEGEMRGPEAQEISKPAPRTTPRPAAKTSAPKTASVAKEDTSDAVSRNAARKSFGDSDAVSRNASRKTFGGSSTKSYASDTSQRFPSSVPRTPRPKAETGRLTKAIGSQLSKYANIAPPDELATKMKSAYRDAAGMKKGGSVKESKAMVNKEVAFFKKKGAPKSMIKHEAAEAKEMKYAKGGAIMRPKKAIAADQMKMAPYARGGGVEARGKTQGKMIKMATGGAVKYARGGGIESRGKTSCKMY